MLKIGIIGNKNLDDYIIAINKLPFFKLNAMFDPSFQIENNSSPDKNITFFSFSDFLQKCDAVVFTSNNRLYYKHIEKAIKYGKATFLHSTSNLSLTEHQQLNKFTEEAKEIVQVFHPYLHTKNYTKFRSNPNKPMLYKLVNTGNNTGDLMQSLRHDISALITVIKAPIKQASIQALATLHDYPDTFSLNLTFDNGATANFTLDAISEKKEHKIIAYHYNKLENINLLSPKSNVEKSKQEICIIEELTCFYHNVLYCKTPAHSIENELATQKIIERVKEKVRFSFNMI